MKRLIIIMIALLLFYNCAGEKESENIVIDPFKNTSKIKSQFFDLDTITLKEVVGKKGTIIYYNRNNFNVNPSDKITLELKEYYKLEDLIKSNIRTLTDSNDLLESSGVVFLEFKKNGEKINLKPNTNISLRFPVKFSEEDRVFSGKIDSLGQMSWSQAASFFTVLKYDKEYRIDVGHEVTIDSLPYYQEIWRKQDSVYEAKYGAYDRIKKTIGNSISLNSLGWLNIDKYVKYPAKMDFEIKNSQNMDGVLVYFVYDDYNSFTSFIPNDKVNISLKAVPTIQNTHMIVVGMKDKELFAQKLPINKKQPIQLNLKKVNATDLVKLFEK